MKVVMIHNLSHSLSSHSSSHSGSHSSSRSGSHSGSHSANQDVPVIIQQVESDLTECLNFNLILLREHLSTKSTDEISTIETDVQMLLPCELLLKLVAMTILTSHSLRLQGKQILEVKENLEVKEKFWR